MKQKALRAGDAHSHEDEECRKRSTLRFGRCLTSVTGAQQRARRENVPRHILFYYRSTENVKSYIMTGRIQLARNMCLWYDNR